MNLDFMTIVCNKCGKPAPMDETISTSNLAVFDLKTPCECGGTFMPKFMADKEKEVEE